MVPNITLSVTLSPLRPLLRIRKTFSCNLYLLYASCLFSMLFNDDIVDIEKPDGFSIKDSRTA